MRIKNIGIQTAIIAAGLGLVEHDQILEVEDSVGRRLLGLARFVEVDEDGEPVALLDPDVAAAPEPGTISDPVAYDAAVAAGAVGALADGEDEDEA